MGKEAQILIYFFLFYFFKTFPWHLWPCFVHWHLKECSIQQLVLWYTWALWISPELSQGTQSQPGKGTDKFGVQDCTGRRTPCITTASSVWIMCIIQAVISSLWALCCFVVRCLAPPEPRRNIQLKIQGTWEDRECNPIWIRSIRTGLCWCVSASWPCSIGLVWFLWPKVTVSGR